MEGSSLVVAVDEGNGSRAPFMDHGSDIPGKKMNQEITLEGDTPKFEGSPSTIRKKQRESRNSTITNEASGLKPKGCLAANVHRGKKK